MEGLTGKSPWELVDIEKENKTGPTCNGYTVTKTLLTKTHRLMVPKGWILRLTTFAISGSGGRTK